MKAKLKKIDPHYFLIVDDKTFGSTMEPHLSASIRHALSLKNCQSIERGYDLDKLKCDYIQEKTSDWVKQAIDENAYELEQDAKCFIDGFLKALELMGDKKFSEKDVRDAYFHGEKDSYVKGGQTKEMENEFIQSLQQTEWDVEIVEQCLDPTCDGVNRKGECITTGKPKLDADGCIILKRV